MNLQRFITIISLALSLSEVSMAQKPHLFTMQQGLKSSYINSLYIDSDNFLWVSTTTSLEFFDGHHFQEINYQGSSDKPYSFNTVNTIKQKDENQYWVLTNQGLYIYDKPSNSLKSVTISTNEEFNKCSLTHVFDFPDSNKTLFSSEGYGFYLIDNNTLASDTLTSQKLFRITGSSYIWDFLIDSHKNLWLSDLNNRLVTLDLTSNKLRKIPQSAEAQSITQNSYVMNFAEDRKSGKIFMAMSNNGVLVYDNHEKQVRELRNNDRSLYTTSILQTRDGHIYLGTDNKGLYEISVEDESLHQFSKEIEDIDIHHAKVHSLAEDKDGNLVVGIYQHGVLVIPKQTVYFEYGALSENSSGKNSACITSFCTDLEGNLWVATDGSGAFINGRCITEGLRSPLLQTLACDKRGTIWSGSWRGGISCCTNKNSFYVPEFLKPYSTLNVMDLEYDATNDILYAGTNGEGIMKIDLQTEQVSFLNGKDTYRWINKIYLDSNGDIWFGDAISFVHYNTKTDKYSATQLETDRINVINAFYEDGDNLLLGTYHGMFCYNTKTNSFVEPDYLRNIPYNTAITNIEMSGHYIWLSTNRHIVCVDKTSGRLTEFSSFSGNYIGEFHKDASMQASDGRLYFGGDNGYVSYLPDQLMNMPKDIKPVYFSQLGIGEELDGHDSYHITFSVPELAMADRINYSYILEGYEKNWHTISSENPEAYYASLPSGTYNFRVRAFYKDNPDHYSERSIKVKVPYPWYATWWAYLLYLVALGIIGKFIWDNIKARQRARSLLLKSAQNEQMKEAKLRLFASIAHELRSPLTMIMSPLRQLKVNDRNLDRQGNYSIMERNCKRIQRIVNQMLDVNRIDSGRLPLHFSETELNTYTKEVMESFTGFAASKAIAFHHESTEKEIPIWIDTVHFEKILFNVLSNAFKFTPSDGRVIVRTSTHLNTPDADNHRVIDDFRVIEYAEIRIYNSGSHLAAEDIKHLWERFYQGNSSKKSEGSGIGLNLSYELVHLHHGDISAHNVGDDGVEFVIRIPVGNVHLKEEELKPRETSSTPSPVPGLSDANPSAGDSSNPSASDIQETSGQESEGQLPATETEENESEDTSISAEEEKLSSLDAVDEADTEDGEESDDDDVEKSDNKEGKGKKSSKSSNKEINRQDLIMIVDDDKDLCEYVSKELSENYKVITSNSGNEAWNTLLVQRPSIVVTDLMMPDGDGYDLCRRIKANPETDNIAVIVLTSETDDDSRLRSMNLQADHFLPKPFNLALLQSAITQVLRVRENIRNKMRRTEIGQNYGSVEIDSYEDKFIQRVKDMVMSHLDDPDFNVNELSKEIGISRVHLNRKLKEHFGISPNAYIRSVRLKQAAYLLVNNKVNVSEVAYRVGFSSHSYFTSIFHDFFGMSPKEFVATYSANLNDETLQKLLD